MACYSGKCSRSWPYFYQIVFASFKKDLSALSGVDPANLCCWTSRIFLQTSATKMTKKMVFAFKICIQGPVCGSWKQAL